MEYQSTLHKKLTEGGFVYTAETTPPEDAQDGDRRATTGSQAGSQASSQWHAGDGWSSSWSWME